MRLRMTTDYVCPHCRATLEWSEERAGAPTLSCTRCRRSYPAGDEIADFSGGAYYDTFHSEDELTAEHKTGLAAEVAGSRWRIERFYASKLPAGARVLDCGCGNGIAVDVLHEQGFEAWGVDLSALRKWQWRERVHRDRLAVADALRLPFPDSFFDVVISSGVIEHIGVTEIGGADYRVRPMPNRKELRQQSVDELLRVTRPGGLVFLDTPNGAFPIDFWHGGEGGRARFHRRGEGFLPTFAEIRSYARGSTIRAVSPRHRFAFQQVRQHWYGRLLAAPMAIVFGLMSLPLLRVLSRTALNPYLVIAIEKRLSRGR